MRRVITTPWYQFMSGVTATLLLTQGVHPKIVQEMLGHASISLTLDVYSHVTPMLQAEAAEKMQAVLSGV